MNSVENRRRRRKESKSNEHVPISHALILIPLNADPSIMKIER